MKAKLMSLALILAIAAGLFAAPNQVKAAGYGTAFATSITYQNIGDSVASPQVYFYSAAGGDPIIWDLPDLPVNAGASLFVGSVTGISTGFTGSAVLYSNSRMAAVLVQLPQLPSTVKNRPLSTGMESGAPSVLIPTVLKNQFNTNSIFVVQNADTVDNNISVKLIPLSGTPITLTATLKPGQAKYYDMGQMAEVAAANFNGSATVDAVKAAGGAGSVVATSLELVTNSDAVYAFEGTADSSNTIFMPSALCNAFGGQNSFYAVQNTSTTDNAAVTVTYSSGVSETQTIDPGKKFSFSGCANGQNANGFSGSATITSVGGAIVAIGKVSGTGVSSAFLGFSSGASKISLPYVRWTTSKWVPGGRQRAFIAIQNVGQNALAAGDVMVEYYDKNGVKVGTHTLGALGAGAKTNSNPSNIAGGEEFGYYNDGTFGGGALVVTKAGVTAELAVVVRVASNMGGSTLVAEDYDGIPVQ